MKTDVHVYKVQLNSLSRDFLRNCLSLLILRLNIVEICRQGFHSVFEWHFT